jgi:hypothetical protein
VFDIAFVIGDVESQDAMGIGPEPFDYSSFHGNSFRRVERCGAMMRKKRNRREKKTNHDMETFRKSISHNGALHLENLSATLVSVCGSGRFSVRSRRQPAKIPTQS